jgi:hypothetical protein
LSEAKAPIPDCCWARPQPWSCGQRLPGKAELAEGHFNEALREPEALDVYCLDPTKGLAQIPFRQGDDLAWFVFDLCARKDWTPDDFMRIRWKPGGCWLTN